MKKYMYQPPEMLLCIVPQDPLLDASGGMVAPEITEEQVTEW